MYNSQTNIQNPGAFIKIITIIYIALITGLLLFGTTAFFITENKGVKMSPADDPFFYVAPLLVIAGGISGAFLFKMAVSKLANIQTLKEKLQGYQTALILRAALSEGPSLFAIVCFLLTGNSFYLIIAGLNVLYFVSFIPTKSKLEDDLNLSYEDKIAMES